MPSKEIAPNGSRRRPSGGWKAYEAEVTQAAAKRARDKRKAGDQSNLRPGRIHLVAKAPRCACIANTTGKQCRNPAMRGAQRCPSHGGRYDVPDHPSNSAPAALDRLARRLEGHEARNQFHQLPPHKRHQAREAIEAHGAQPRRGTYWQDLLAIAQALDLDDGGRQMFKLMRSFRKTHGAVE